MNKHIGFQIDFEMSGVKMKVYTNITQNRRLISIQMFFSDDLQNLVIFQ